jgi:hypothetical protein
MPAVLLLTLMAIQAGDAQPPDASNPAIQQEIGMAVHDRAGVPAGWLKQAQDEMTRIYAEIGVRINWHAAPLPASSENGTSAPPDDLATWPSHTLLIVITPSSGQKPGRSSENVVGFASGTATERARVVYLLYDSIDQFPILHRGRMLGHIMAHEIGHALLPFQSHSPQGLMRARWDRADLELAQARRLRFTADHAELIRRKVAQLIEGAP